MAITQLSLNQTTLLGATTGTIECLLIPVTGKVLLLPNITVVNVLPAADMAAAPASAAAGVVGSVSWQGNSIPVLAFEGMNGQALPQEYSHIAVVSGISAQRVLPFYGIAAQSEPRMAKVKIAQLEDLEAAPTGPVEFLQVRYAGELAVIPDLDALEAPLLA